MTSRYDPRNNIPGYIPPSPELMQGDPSRVPLTLEGASQEDLRREIMRRTGQYGPLPMHRTRGSIGGRIVKIGERKEWAELLRVDHWHSDATGMGNGSFKTLITLGGAQLAYEDIASTGLPLGMVTRLQFGAGGAVLNTLYFDTPTNGMVHVPFCAETVIAEVAMELKVFPDSSSMALWKPDSPVPQIVSLADSGLDDYPQISAALVEAQALPTNPVNMPTRQIAVVLATGGDSVLVPIPRGTQAVRVSGPGDLIASQFVPHDNSGGQPNSIAIAADTIEPLFSSAAGISVASANDGGITAFWFYLGI